MRSFASGELRAKISSRCLAQQRVELALAQLLELGAGDDAAPSRAMPTRRAISAAVGP